MSNSPDRDTHCASGPAGNIRVTSRLGRRAIGLLMFAGWCAAVQCADIDPRLQAAAISAPQMHHRVLVRLKTSVPPNLPVAGYETVEQRRRQTVESLRMMATNSQASLKRWLNERSVTYRDFWLGNMLALDADLALVETLAARVDVEVILLDRIGSQTLPMPTSSMHVIDAVRAIEPNIAHIGVPAVWQTGISGQGVVIAGQDTGYQWDHPALKVSYRGWNGSAASHDHNWHDAIHELIDGGVNSCGVGLPAPCDDNNHGSHTMGTMVGDDGGSNQIGVAPGARWIGCRNMEEGDGRPSTYTECFQWFLAPTAIDGSDSRPDLAPHIVNNSWGCPVSEGCTEPEIELMHEVVNVVHDAGIMVVVSAGNNGSGCGSIDTPAAIYASSLTVGATGASSDGIASLSSRGPTPDGLLKPDIVAPGIGIRSSIVNNAYASFSGTSMAGPHVAGVAALLMSVNPALRGDPDAVAAILRNTAVPLTSGQDCGVFPGAAIPNAVYGHGRIDAWAAFRVAETIFAHDFE
jgi:hypothetical protein